MAISFITFLIALSIFWLLLLIVANVLETKKYGIFVSPFLLLIKIDKLGDLAHNISQKVENPLKKLERALLFIGMTLFITLPVSLLLNLFIPSAPIFSVVPITALTVENLLIFLFSLFIALVVHEFAHAVMGFVQGEEIETIGIGIVGFFAVAFTQFPKATLPSLPRRTRVNIIVAGILANLAFVSFLVPVAIFSEQIVTLGYERKPGAYIISVDPFGPADLANITSGTVVSEISILFGGIRTRTEIIVTHYDLINYLRNTPPKSLIELGTNRGTKQLFTEASPRFPNGSTIGITVYYNYKGKFFDVAPELPYYFTLFVHWLLNVNLFLAIYNLLPIPFSDGQHLLETVFPKIGKRKLRAVNALAILLLAANLFRTTPPL